MGERAGRRLGPTAPRRSEEHTSELQSQSNLVCRLLLEKKKQVTHETSFEIRTMRPAISTIDRQMTMSRTSAQVQLQTDGMSRLADLCIVSHSRTLMHIH